MTTRRERADQSGRRAAAPAVEVGCQHREAPQRERDRERVAVLPRDRRRDAPAELDVRAVEQEQQRPDREQAGCRRCELRGPTEPPRHDRQRDEWQRDHELQRGAVREHDVEQHRAERGHRHVEAVRGEPAEPVVRPPRQESAVEEMCLEELRAPHVAAPRSPPVGVVAANNKPGRSTANTKAALTTASTASTAAARPLPGRPQPRIAAVGRARLRLRGDARRQTWRRPERDCLRRAFALARALLPCGSRSTFTYLVRARRLRNANAPPSSTTTTTPITTNTTADDDPDELDDVEAAAVDAPPWPASTMSMKI